MNYIGAIAVQMGISVWMLSIIFTWSLIWKLLALWKSARNNSVAWFIILAIVNTVGILEILYIFVFSKMNCFGLKNSERKIPAKRNSIKKKIKKRR
jgi:methionyl-tRNA synthetase